MAYLTHLEKLDEVAKGSLDAAAGNPIASPRCRRVISVAGRGVMSFQVTVLNVLAGHPGGCLPIDDLKRAVAILVASGPDWTDRMKRLLARAPDLDIFGQSLVICDDHQWQITEAGLALLATIENPAAGAATAEDAPKAEQLISSVSTALPAHHVERRQRKSGRRAGRRAA